MASITLSWSANPAADNVTGYDVYGANGSSVAFGSCVLLATVTALTWTDTGLANGQARTYYLKAVNAVGLSATPEGPLNITAAAASSTYVQNAGGTPSVQEGTHASRPAAGTAGRVYIETDTESIFRDNGVSWDQIGSSTTFANPTGTAKDTAVNGVATTAMRSDAAPAVQKGSSSQYGIVKPDGSTIVDNGSGVLSAVGGAVFNGSWFSTTMAVLTYWWTGANSFTATGDVMASYGTSGGGGSGAGKSIGITLNSSGSASGYRGNPIFLSNDGLNGCFTFAQDGSANIRCWMGYNSGTSFGSATPNSAYIAFRYDSSAGDSHWQCAAGTDNTHQTLVDSGVTPDTTLTLHQFAIIVNAAGTSADFYIDGTKVGTITTNLPSTATGLRMNYEATALTATVRIAYMGAAYTFRRGAP